MKVDEGLEQIWGIGEWIWTKSGGLGWWIGMEVWKIGLERVVASKEAGSNMLYECFIDMY